MSGHAFSRYDVRKEEPLNVALFFFTIALAAIRLRITLRYPRTLREKTSKKIKSKLYLQHAQKNTIRCTIF